ncbi:MAG: hypothetical protein ACKOCN_04895, partial [Planctomycetaceae bacterium]
MYAPSLPTLPAATHWFESSKKRIVAPTAGFPPTVTYPERRLPGGPVGPQPAPSSAKPRNSTHKP